MLLCSNCITDNYRADVVCSIVLKFFWIIASEEKAPSFAQELTELEGEICAPLELLKWFCFKQTDHTLPAIGLALFEKTVNTQSSMHKVIFTMGVYGYVYGWRWPVENKWKNIFKEPAVSKKKKEKKEKKKRLPF